MALGAADLLRSLLGLTSVGGGAGDLPLCTDCCLLVVVVASSMVFLLMLKLLALVVAVVFALVICLILLLCKWRSFSRQLCWLSWRLHFCCGWLYFFEPCS